MPARRRLRLATLLALLLLPAVCSSVALLRAECPPAALPAPRLLARRAFANVTRLTIRGGRAAAADGRPVALPARRAAAACSRARGQGVVVYVVDTGCRSTHAQLAGRMRTAAAPGSRFRDGEDDHGHGTHVAATIAGAHVGLAPRARVVCIKALSSANEGSGKDVMAAIRLAVREHPRGAPGIISISLGVRADARYRALDAAIARAARVGIVSVVAAGNAAADACTFTPARAETAMTVAAVGLDGRLARFSNWGPCVVVAAPGVAVWSAVAAGDDMYGVSSGTSMAAPFVSGLVALRLGDRPVNSVFEVKQWLRQISKDAAGLPVVSVDGFCRWSRRYR